MDPYSKDLHMQNKGYVTDQVCDLASLQQDHTEAQPRFGVDEPLEVQLRFELGSLVDTHVLIDTDGSRESHWDFVRQEQGRFQTSSEENTDLLSHVKPDDLKSFDNCERWQTSQVDTQLFLDAQDDVSMITEAFGNKDKNMTDLAEDDRGLLLPSSYRQCEEETTWIGQDKEKAHISCREGFLDAAAKTSQTSPENLDARVADESAAEYSEINQGLVDERKEKHEAGQLVAEFVKEPLPSKAKSSEVEAAFLTVGKPESTVRAFSSETVNPHEEIVPERNEEWSSQPELPIVDNVTEFAQTETATPMGEVVQPVDAAQVFHVSEKEPKMDTACLKVEMDANESDRILSTPSESTEMESSTDLVSKTSLTQASPEFSVEPVNQNSDLLVETLGAISDTGKKSITQGGPCIEKPGGSCLESECLPSDPVEKHSTSIMESTEAGSKTEVAEEITAKNSSDVKSFQETTVLSILEASTTDENVVKKVVAPCQELEKPDEANDKARETLDGKWQMAPQVLTSESGDNPLSSVKVIIKTTTEVHGVCPTPATCALEQGDSYESGAGVLENKSSVNSLDNAVDIPGISNVADLGVIGAGASCEGVTEGQLGDTKTPQVSGGYGDLEPAESNMDSHEQEVEGNLDKKQSGEPENTTSDVLTVMHSSAKKLLEKQVDIQGKTDSFGQKQSADSSDPILQELKYNQHNGGEQNTESSMSAKPTVSSEKGVSTDISHPGGILHVLLDVHKDGITDDSPPKNASGQDRVEIIEGEGLTDVHTSNTGDASRLGNVNGGANATGGCPDNNISGSTAQAAIAGSQEDSTFATPPPDNFGKRKADSITRNNRLKDSARASPLQARTDRELKIAGIEGLGRRKATPKTTAQKKGSEPLEGVASPKKPGSKSTSGRKKGALSPIVQDAGFSAAEKEGAQTPASISQTVFSVNSIHHVPPDLNGLEVVAPMVSPAQPFSEPQQVQLRAQILVYGALIQGAAPDEALMVAAFSNVNGVQVGRDTEASARAVWEKQWQAAVERINTKNSRDTIKDSSCANAVLASGSPATTAKATEGGLKPNSSSGVAINAIDGRHTQGVPARASDVSGAKSQSSRPRQATDSALDISVSRSGQTLAPAAPPGPVVSTTSRSVSSSLSESFIQHPKSRADPQQMTPPIYFPTPPVGPYLTGAPQWFSTASFPGSWMPQTQATVYNAPPALFTQAQAIVSSDQTVEIRRSTPPSSGTVMPASSSFVPTLFTPVVGGLSPTPTSVADPLQNKQPVSESRPRKRKKTHSSETYVLSTDVNPLHATGITPTSASFMPTGQACLGISSPVYSPPIMTPEALALAVSNTQVPKSSQEMSIVAVHTGRVPVPSSSSIPSAGPSLIESWCEKSNYAQNSANQLSSAQASAEEAAAVAASALSESESLWSRLKAQKSTGLSPDIESQLVSSAVAMAAAASVAKAAAAAAKAAYEAAVQAKRISERVLESGKGANEPDSSRLLGDKADNASRAWRMPESCNSILASARMASKQRLEAVSAARVRAENFDSVVRAAELATDAITQVGSIMAMGESVPFNLEMLLESGPEGLHKLDDKVKTKPKGTALQSPGRRGTPKSIEREKKLPFRITSGNKEAVSQKDAQLDNWKPDSLMAVGPENDARMNSELGVVLMTDFSKQKTNDHLAVSMPASRQGLLTTRSEGGLMEQEASDADDKIVKGSLVEVMSDEKGLRGVWFSARVQSVDEEKVFVLYDDLLADDGYSPLEEWIQMKASSGKAPRVRLAHPHTNIGFDGTRKRRREAMGSHKWSVGDRVDAYIRDGWWEGEIKEIIEDGESKAKVFFPGDGDTSLVKTSKLRPSLVWSNGHWVLWNDAKQGKKESSRARTDPHEGDTPLAKRQRTEKSQASSLQKQKLLPASISEASAAHKEASLLKSNTVNLQTDFEGLTADGVAKAKQQGPKVVFGIPRPTKKRKLIEVSKHFTSAKGLPGTTVIDVKAANKKSEAALVFAPGSSEASRLDGLKAKKRVLQPKARPPKDPDSDAAHLKASAMRSRKEKTVVAPRTLVRNNAPNKEGLPLATRNREGKVMRKKKLPSDNNQSEPQEQPEDRAVTSSATILDTNTSSVAVEDIGKESSLAPEKNENPSEAVKESGGGPSQAAEEIAKQPSEQLKDSEMQSSITISGNKPTSHTSKRKETEPFKEKEEAAHLVKENPQVQGKGSEPHPAHEGGENVDVSSEKESAIVVNDGEKQSTHAKELEKSKEVGKSASETFEPRRTSRKIQPTSKLLEGLQTAPKLGKTSSSHDRGNRGGSKAAPQT